MEITLPNNWAPRGYQQGLWQYLEHGGRRANVVCHRRWGKDEIALHFAATQCALKPATYWHMLPQQAQARKAIWLAVNPHTGKRRIDEAFPPAFRKRTNDQEMFIETVTGAFWHVVGSDNYNSLVGSPPAGVVLSEWALANPAAWAYLEPILLENDGWALFIYTSRGKNHGYQTYQLAKASEAWYCENQTVDDTDVYTQEKLFQAKQTNIALYGHEMGEMLFKQEYYNAFEGGELGSYYAAELAHAEKAGRITGCPYEPGVPVRVYFDLGNAPNLVMWFGQYVGMEPRVIDYEQPLASGLDAVAEVLNSKRYNYYELVLPHDGGHKQMGDSQGRTYAQLLQQATGIKTRVLERADLLPGLQAVYAFIGKMVMDQRHCAQGLEALYSYKREWDDTKRKFKDTPRHDWASHPADGFRYMALDMKPVRLHSGRKIRAKNSAKHNQILRY